jgi:two-component system, NtrC family, sensor histidine kinase HydH
VILLLFEPLRSKAEDYTHKVFFRERVDLERAVAKARGVLVHTLQVAEMQQIVISALEESHRATGAAIYLRDPLGSDFVVGLGFGPVAPPRIELAAAHPLAERMNLGGAILLEDLAHQVIEHRRSGRTHEAEADERLLSSAQLLGPFRTGVCLGIWGEKRELLGLLLVVDDRVRDAFSPDEGVLLESLAVQIGVVIDNSRQYRRMQERDRLAALGQMAAGLAHEVKNPLGAIKGAAQLLGDPGKQQQRLGPVELEFVGIILEEVERLDRVVGSVLDYARPSKGELGAVDLNAVVRRTVTVLASDRAEECQIVTDLSDAVRPVRADAEQLRQVLINLVRNAIQAMGGQGTVRVRTAIHAQAPSAITAVPAGEWVEVSVRDAGPGIAPSVLRNLFVPFFTTKDRGTGLGLAISQRMVEEMGGRIEVASHLGDGATFTVLLPASEAHGHRAGLSPTPPEAGEAAPALLGPSAADPTVPVRTI